MSPRTSKPAIDTAIVVDRSGMIDIPPAQRISNADEAHRELVRARYAPLSELQKQQPK